jgi:RNA polymerase sigma factor (sigma-70 family)
MNSEPSRGSDISLRDSSQSSTKTLLERGRVGDGAALDRLFARVLGPIRRWAHGRVPRRARSVADTADFVQDATVGVFRRLDTIDLQNPGDLEAYIRRAVQNRIVDEARRIGRTPEQVALDSALPSSARSPFEDAASREFLEHYASVLSRLDADEREAVVARFELGYSYKQMAILLGKPSAAAARMTINRITERMHDLLNRPT